MINKFKPKSDFSSNVLTLMTGTTIAQAIPIAISPILTRIYTPEDFGVFTLFIAISSIFGSIVTGRYELAIMLPEKDEDAINIFALGFLITFFISLILFIVIFLFHKYFIQFLHNMEIGVWLYFVPISVFFIGIYNLLNYFNNRKKNYKDISNATIVKAIVLAIIQLSVGFIQQGATGLISGQIISNMFANLKLVKNIMRDQILLSSISKIKIIFLAKKYKDFPKFSMLAVLANSLSQHLTNILISTFYSVSTLGLYSLVYRVLGIPSALIGRAIGQVFFQEATKEKQKTGKTIKSFNSTLKKLIILGLPFFSILFFIIKDIFIIVFGESWLEAGRYAQCLIPLFFVKFISSSLSSVLVVYEKQKSELIINIILLSSAIGVIYYSIDFDTFLFLFIWVMIMNYIVFVLYYYKLSKGN